MNDFKDSTGAVWYLGMQIGHADELKASTGIDFLEPSQELEKLIALKMSVRKRIDMLWDVVRLTSLNKTQLEQLQLPPRIEGRDIVLDQKDAFLDRLGAAETMKALEALKNEIDFFIQSLAPQVAARLKKMESTSDKIEAMEIATIGEMLDDPKVEAMVMKQAQQAMDKAVAEMEGALPNLSGP